jgi:citrate synthase
MNAIGRGTPSCLLVRRLPAPSPTLTGRPSVALAAPRQRAVLDEVLARTQSHGLPQPNVNLAVGAVAYAAGLAPEAGETLFTIARMTGWVAHYLEELREAPRRYRTRTVYTGES